MLHLTSIVRYSESEPDDDLEDCELCSTGKVASDDEDLDNDPKDLFRNLHLMAPILHDVLSNAKSNQSVTHDKTSKSTTAKATKSKASWKDAGEVTWDTTL